MEPNQKEQECCLFACHFILSQQKTLVPQSHIQMEYFRMKILIIASSQWNEHTEQRTVRWLASIIFDNGKSSHFSNAQRWIRIIYNLNFRELKIEIIYFIVHSKLISYSWINQKFKDKDNIPNKLWNYNGNPFLEF